MFYLIPVKKMTPIQFSGYQLTAKRNIFNIYMQPSFKMPFYVIFTVLSKTVQKVGLKTATNLVMRIPTCLRFKGKEYHQGVSSW